MFVYISQCMYSSYSIIASTSFMHEYTPRVLYTYKHCLQIPTLPLSKSGSVKCGILWSSLPAGNTDFTPDVWWLEGRAEGGVHFAPLRRKLRACPPLPVGRNSCPSPPEMRRTHASHTHAGEKERETASNSHSRQKMTWCGILNFTKQMLEEKN